MEAGF